MPHAGFPPERGRPAFAFFHGLRNAFRRSAARPGDAHRATERVGHIERERRRPGAARVQRHDNRLPRR